MSRKVRLTAFAAVLVLGILVVVQTFGISYTQLGSATMGETKLDSNTKLNKPIEIDESKIGKETQAETEIKDDAKDLTEKPGKEFDPSKEFTEILSFSPVVIFSKTYCPYSKKLKELLKNEYELYPTPTIVELDKHKHGKELQDYIGEKSGRTTVPNLFINGISRGGSDDMKALHDSGKLLDSLVEWGGKALKVTKHSVPSNS